MGIRFFCPNGHPLNVKSELAGKIGFCPQCNVRMVIPNESTRTHGERFELGKSCVAQAYPDDISEGNEEAKGNNTELESADAVGISSFGASQQIESTDSSPENSLVDIIRLVTVDSSIKDKGEGERCSSCHSQHSVETFTDDDHSPWFVRSSADKEPYGPATNDVIKNWIKERRITPTMLVTRSSWKEWEEAGKIFPEVNRIFEEHLERQGERISNSSLASYDDVPTLQDGNRARQTLTGSSSSLPNEDFTLLRGATHTRHIKGEYSDLRQKRASTSLYIIIGLIILSLILLGVLVFLLLR